VVGSTSPVIRIRIGGTVTQRLRRLDVGHLQIEPTREDVHHIVGN